MICCGIRPQLNELSIFDVELFDLYVYNKASMIMIEHTLNHVELTIIKRQGQQKITFPKRDILFSCGRILDS